MVTAAATRPAVLRMPVVTFRNLAVPAPLRDLTARGFKDSAWLADIDGNELLKCDPHVPKGTHIPVLRGANLRTVINFLEKPGKIAYITGSAFLHQEQRTIFPVRDELRRTGQMHLLDNIVLYANRGASFGRYFEDGSMDQETYRKYVDQYGISRATIDAIEEVANEEIARFWADYQANPDHFRDKFNYVASEPPIFQKRDRYPADRPESELICAPQVAMLPFPHNDVMNPIIDRMRSSLPKEIADSLSLTPGGGTTIDINREGVSKATAFEHFIRKILHIAVDEHESPLRHPLPYTGDETSRIVAEDGSVKKGGDTFPLAIPNCFILGFDEDPRNVIQIPGRAFYMGRGPEANLAVRRWVIRNWEKPQAEAEIRVPFMEAQDVAVPDAVLNARRSRFAGTLVACSGSLVTGFVQEKDVKSSKVDPTAKEIAAHIQAGLPFVIASGGDYSERMLPLIDAISKMCDPSAMKNLLTFSNNGAIMVGFDGDGKKRILSDLDQTSIIPEDESALAAILQAISDEYRKNFGGACEFPQVQTRTDDNHTLQISLLPYDIDKRGWILIKFNEAMKADKDNGGHLSELYGGQFGGLSFDVGRKANTKDKNLEKALAYFGLPKTAPIIYLGGQFFSDVDITGETITGVDMSVLKFDKSQLTPIALNEHQDSIPNCSRLFRAGSGGEALAKWLEFMHEEMRSQG